ncbi:hypothetical protein FRX31_006566 [Thalictrum thalictroides]|uniref:Uncharacterized protein n=1 Tax=Thalictrum thalictroides TaxID=46969 RepID=A0A7J6X4S4_THATH|nr:hypothetical protein FRX31_006566 [Thalictrum thalictroides]
MKTFYVNLNDGSSMKTTVIDEASHVDSCLTELILSCNYNSAWPFLIALDVNFKKPNTDHIETLQLATRTRCLILQLHKMKANLPQSLQNLLSANLFCFVGVRMQESLFMIGQEYGLYCRNSYELGPALMYLAAQIGDLEVEEKLSSGIVSSAAANLTKEEIESSVYAVRGMYEIGCLHCYS